MKKTAFILGISLFATCFSETNQEIANRKIDEFISGYATNQVFTFLYYKTNWVDAAEADSRLESTPPVNFISTRFSSFPKTRAAAFRLMEQHCGFEIPLAKSGNPKHPSDKMDRLVYILSFIDRVGCIKYSLDTLIQDAQSLAPKSIRRKLRKEGKSILVDKDGNDPCMPYMNQLTEALEAPGFAGLSNALENCGISVKFPETYRYDNYILSGENLVNLTNAIYFGDVKFSQDIQAKLRFILGLKEYNKFVERYNGK